MVYVLFFLSGAAGLIYEMAWSRQLGLLFGHTVHASAIVLGSFFAGMAIGYLISGRISGRINKPLAAYGLAELIVAGWAVITPFLFAALRNPQAAALLNHSDPAVQLAARAVTAFMIMLPATAAMGATLPFAAAHFQRLQVNADSRIAAVYAWNTAGAVTGVLSVTFLLILYVGVVSSNWLAGGVSALCGLAAIALAAGIRYDRTEIPADEPESGEKQTGAVRQQDSRLWLWLAALSGAGILSLEVLYTKMFALVLHNSTYTFGVVVAVFLFALAAGGWLVSRYGRRFSPRHYLPLVCTAGPLLILAGVIFFQRFTQLGYYQPGGGFGGYILGVVGLTAACILPGIMVLATILPWTWRGLAESDRSSVVGRLTAANTVCASAGAILTSFVLLPAVGLWPGISLVCVLYAVTGLLLALRNTQFARYVVTCLVLLVPIGVAIALIQVPINRVYRDTEVIFERETAYGLIDVLRRENGELWLRQNNHYTLGATYGGDSELRQGHIPLVLHDNPQDVCFLGLATGITTSSALMHPGVETVTAVELIPEVVEAAGLYAEYNMDVTSRDDVKIVVNDARHFLYAADQQYDAIISDLFVPWHSQTGYLYTVEHYRAARKRLKPGGIFCQWVPLYQVSELELELIANSFAEVFPVVTMWRGEFSGESPLVGLVGSEAALTIDGTETQRRVAMLPAPFTGTDPVLGGVKDLLDLYMGDWVRQPGALLNSDEHPRVEFLAPISQRRKQKLTGKALADYYLQTVYDLPVQNIVYTPRLGEAAPQLGASRYRQLDNN